MMSVLKGVYSNFRPTDNPDQARAYMEAIERMVAEFGMGRTAAAIQKACDLIPDFVPTPAKIREFMPAVGGKLKTCTLCHPSGFVRVFEGVTSSEPNSVGVPAQGGNPIDPVAGAVRRCDHLEGKSPVVEVDTEEREYGTDDVKALWKIHKEKRARVGRALTESEIEQCVDELDLRIDAVEKRGSGRIERAGSVARSS
jgi:hypothetical protein